MTATTTDAASPLAKLELQRDFLLRSLADLDAERAAGELDEARYRRLHDEYTTKAALVLEAIDRVRVHADQAATAPDGPAMPPTRRARRRFAIVAVVVVPAVAVGGLALSRAVGDRAPGQTISGNAQAQASSLAALERAAKARSDDEDAQLAYAQALLQANRALDALKAFDAAARIAPGDPAPKAYGGWIVFLAGLPDEALRRLDAAVAADPAYPDARFFRGMVRLRARDDTTGALADWRAYLRLAPAGAERDQVRALVDQTVKASPTTTTVNR
jgi:cytochrome c-type biogenesis protein CcmH/NrfG